MKLVENTIIGDTSTVLIADLDDPKSIDLVNDREAVKQLLERGAIDIIKRRRVGAWPTMNIVVATVSNLRREENLILGEVAVNSFLRYYLDGTTLRHRVNALYQYNYRHLRSGHDKKVRVTNLSLLDPYYVEVADNIKQQDIENGNV